MAGRAQRIVVCVAILGAAACDSPTLFVASPGYNPTSLAPFIYHWPAGHTIAIYADRTEEPPGADLLAAVKDGIAAWEAVARLGEIRLRVVSDVHDADVVFHHSRAPRLVESDVCSPFDIGAGGYTFFCLTDDLDPVTLGLVDGTGGRVMMDVAVNRFALDTAAFFPALVVHEMGHVLGIGAHSPNPADLMYGRPRRFAPTEADATTLRYVLARKPDVIF